MDETTVAKALGGLSSGLQSDGFDLYVMDITAAGDIVVCLQARPTACLECLVPDDMLHKVVENAIRRAEPTTGQVMLVKKGFEELDAH